MKIFFKRQKENEIIALYESINETQNLLWYQHLFQFSCTISNMVNLLLNAIRIFIDFAYTPWPSTKL